MNACRSHLEAPATRKAVDALLGRFPDVEVSRLTGVHTSAVKRRRHRLKIAPSGRKSGALRRDLALHAWLAEQDEPLAVRDIAARYEPSGGRPRYVRQVLARLLAMSYVYNVAEDEMIPRWVHLDPPEPDADPTAAPAAAPGATP